MNFVWDPKKNIENIAKHGVSFDMAQKAFGDPSRKFVIDTKHSIIEKRYFCYAKIDGEIITVRFTLRAGNIRIIGAGFWREGKKIYYENS